MRGEYKQKKISDIIGNLQGIIENYGDLDVITSKDDEMNGFNEVWSDPIVGYFTNCGNFYAESDFESWDIDADKVNVVCL